MNTSFHRMPNQLFGTDDEHFSFDAHGVTLSCKRLNFQERVGYYIEFSSLRKPLFIVKAKGVDVDEFWTSLPEGRQSEAEGVGKLIEDYLNSKT